jgi:glutamine amidotransferase
MFVVIDYGLGNLRSVSKALEAEGAQVKVANNLSTIKEARAIILPGVGAFYRGIENLKKLGILDVIVEEIKKGKPFLGICLGLQLLFTESEEHTVSRGMDVFRGKVVKFKHNVKIPHMGWNQVTVSGQRSVVNVNLFEGIPDNSYFYFVHSYYVEPEDKNIVTGSTFYGQEFTSVIVKDNIVGVQFHPEKSGEIGLKLLKNFINSIK